MNIAEMHIEFRAGLDKTNSLSYPDFRPEEIDLWLNKSIDSTVKQRYGGTNLKGSSVEETQKRRDDLRGITKDYHTTIIAPTSSENKPNGHFVSIPSNYWFALEEECEIEYNDCNGKPITDRVNVKSITHSRYDKIINDPFNKPDKTEVLCLPIEDGVAGMRNELISDGSTIKAYYMRYIRRPAKVSLNPAVNCDLSEHLHREIVDYAVNLVLENIESPRFQTQNVQISRNE